MLVYTHTMCIYTHNIYIHTVLCMHSVYIYIILYIPCVCMCVYIYFIYIVHRQTHISSVYTLIFFFFLTSLLEYNCFTMVC